MGDQSFSQPIHELPSVPLKSASGAGVQIQKGHSLPRLPFTGCAAPGGFEFRRTWYAFGRFLFVFVH
jgi:hypothetical protein